MEDQHKEREKEEEPTDQRKQEAAGNPEEPKEEEQPEVDKPEEPKDQRKEEGEEEPEVGHKSGELTGQRKEEEPEVDSKSGGLTNQRKAEPVEEEKEKETERSSDQDSMEASSPFAHPCSQLLQYLARACARCLGMPDPFDGARPSAAPAASLNSSREVGVAAVNKAGDSTGVYYMQEVITRVWVRLRRPRPGGGNPREGPGGNGGVHH